MSEGLPSFNCPITHELMQEAVIAGDGHTYERAAIVNWLQQHDRSPVTNEKLSSRALLPNHTIRKAIMEYCEETGRPLPVAEVRGPRVRSNEAATGHNDGTRGMDVDDDGEEEDLGQLSWRDGYLSDWLLLCGEATYAVHRANLAAGPRASTFFRKLFAAAIASSNTGESITSTDLSQRLPRECWEVMDQVLDFIYDGVFKPTSDSVLFLLKASVVMGMKELRLRSSDYINVTLTRDSALKYLRHFHLECPGTRDVFLSSLHVSAVSFNDYQPHDLNELPYQVFMQLLSHEQLHSYDKTLSNICCCYARANEARLDADSFTSLADHLRMVAVEDATYFLAAASRFHAPRLVERCVPTVAKYFYRVPRKDVMALDLSVLIAILSSDDLCVASEDVIFDLIQEYRLNHPTLSESTWMELWSTCRLSLLSVTSLAKALRESSMPPKLVAEAAVGRLMLSERGSEEDLASMIDSCSLLKPSQARRRRVTAVQDNHHHLIPGCRVAIRVERGSKQPQAEGDAEAAAAAASSVNAASAEVIEGVLVVVNDHNRCDVLCDSGSYEVDIPLADLHPVGPATAAAMSSSSSNHNNTFTGAAGATSRRSSSNRHHRSRDGGRGERARVVATTAIAAAATTTLRS